MPRPYDPPSHIPSPAAIERALHEAEVKAERLRILLRVSRELKAAEPKPTPGSWAARSGGWSR